MNSNWKRATAAMLGAALLASTGLPAFAEGNETTTPEAGETQAQPAPYAVGAKATIKEIPADLADQLAKGSAQITVDAEENGVKVEVVLNLGSHTVFMDNKTGAPVSAADLKKGDVVFVYHSAAMTRSLPPQTATYAVLVNVGEAQPAKLHQVETVKKNEDGSVTVLSDNGSILVTIGKDTPISPLYTKNVVTLEDIKEESRIFAWYDVVALSYPGQANAQKVVLLPAEEKPAETPEEQAIAVSINGKATEITANKTDSDVVMVPLRAVAEELGYTVTWNQAEKSAHLTNGKGQTTVTMGQDSYFYSTAVKDMTGMSAPTALGSAPVMEEPGTLWVPANLFSLLTQQEAVKLEGNTLNINVK